jgi:hypothetical protein
MFPVPFDTFRGGIDNLQFGLAYALFNEKKDDTKPTWIVGIEYSAPTSERLDPSAPPTNTASRGPIGDRIHKYLLYTSLSRRIGVADPYFKAHWLIPYRGPGWFSNCDRASVITSMSRPQNCGVDPWTRSETGIQPRGEMGMLFGSEFVAYEEPVKNQKVAIDLRGIANYIGKGRYYNEVSDLFGKLMMTDDYYQVGGMVKVAAHAAEYAHFSLGFTLLYNTEHLLSEEIQGIDGNGNNQIDVNPPVYSEWNPNFDFRIDAPSRRIRAREHTMFTIDLAASFIF